MSAFQMGLDMTQPSAAEAKLVDKNDNPQIANRQTAITAITDSTGGTASDTIDDATLSIRDDISSLAAKINAIIDVLEAHGLVADN